MFEDHMKAYMLIVYMEVCNDNKYNFPQFLGKDNSVSIHYLNLQKFVIKTLKIKNEFISTVCKGTF